MNYAKHYALLIERAKHRKLSEYKERHHIIPRCIGGRDNPENLVDLTPEEHYVAHQLLVKMYPNEPGLIYAAMMMAVAKSSNQVRNNKIYGWLRRKYRAVASTKQKGENNSQYGTCWVSNFKTRECKKIRKGELETYLAAGWVKKRILNWKDYNNDGNRIKYCKRCNRKFATASKGQSKLCEACCNKSKNDKSKKEFYTDLFFQFLKSDCVSISEFHKQIAYDKSLVSLTQNFKRYINGYSDITCKRSKKMKDQFVERFLET